MADCSEVIIVGAPKRCRPPSDEELRKDPKKTKFHHNHVVPIEFFADAVADPKKFLLPSRQRPDEQQSSGYQQNSIDARAPFPCDPPPPGSSVGPAAVLTSGEHPDDRENSLSPLAQHPCVDQQSSDNQQTSLDAKAPSPSVSPQQESSVGPIAARSASIASSPNTGTAVRRFGFHSEALLRNCYLEVLQEIGAENDSRNERIEKGIENGNQVFEIRGSAGIGKSAFLAFLIASFRMAGMDSFAIFHASRGDDENKKKERIICSVWVDGIQVMDRKWYGLESTMDALDGNMSELDALFMDDCSISLSSKFTGAIYVAASPSVSTKNLRKAVSGNYVVFCLPPWSLAEAITVGLILNIKKAMVEDNHSYMGGIVRYLFDQDMAKKAVINAVDMVNTEALITLVESNEKDKDKARNMVHSLVLWETQVKANNKFEYKGKVSFRLVSRFAERKVAEKLSKCDLAELRRSKNRLSSVLGAQGYAGSLFEAYAIKKIAQGGEFKICCIEDHAKEITITIPRLGDPLVQRSNTLSTQLLPTKELLQKRSPNGMRYVPRLIWPETTNFPAFDAYYLHEDGNMYPLQMTIAADHSGLSPILNHDLNSNGAYQTSQYLDNVAKQVERTNKGNTYMGKRQEKGITSLRKHKAVFVAPSTTRAKKQKFRGSITNQTPIIKGKQAAELMDKTFEQWILCLD